MAEYKGDSRVKPQHFTTEYSPSDAQFMQVQQIHLGTLDYFANLEWNKLFYLQILTPSDADRFCSSSSSQRDLMSAFAREPVFLHSAWWLLQTTIVLQYSG